ncbi:hypothetical protein AAFC00_005120 [Neodothiora populina]|uniref:Zn(2)-C6 fungal-type domain-containing protein n=1 Tax=Neodothiora populina TaxID=2781224 RepID=A0ABR3PL17_9PEZI
MSSRKYHQKSRNGCVQCKKRRVKCDENRPFCKNCQRTHAPCSYTSSVPATPRESSASVVSSPQSGATPWTEQINFDLLDLRLMHHYTLTAANELFPRGHGQTIWQHKIPLEAQSHPMLMHGLLAISAAHLALNYAKDGTDYRIRAIHHQNMGLLGYRAAISEISSLNAIPSFVFSVMLGVLTFAGPRLSAKEASIDDALELFTLMRGSKVVWELEKQTVLTSPMVALIPPPDWDFDKLDAGLEAKLEDLKLLSPGDAVYTTAVDELKLCMQVALAAPDDFLITARWMATVDEQFWVRLKAHDPIALLLFAHYSLILSAYEQIWWLGDWKAELIKAVDSTLSPGDKEAVKWSSRVEFLGQYRGQMR